jgi:ABC-2 type transport system permease protein/oleandomycin transport system permease protein
VLDDVAVELHLDGHRVVLHVATVPGRWPRAPPGCTGGTRRADGRADRALAGRGVPAPDRDGGGVTTTAVPIPVQAAATRPRLASLTHTRLLVWRNLVTVLREPQAAVFVLIQPVMFVLMFRYVFGGAIDAPGLRYVDYLMPGIFVQTVAFAGITTAVGLATDLRTGIVDRLRSMPMAPWVVLAGRTGADTLRTAVVLVVMALVGLAVGWRPDGSALDLLLGAGLMLLFGHALLWAYAWVGLGSSSPEAAQAATFPLVFPLVFASSIFVPVATMPGWLQGFAEHQPVSVTATAVRALATGADPGGAVWQSAAWSVGLVAVLLPLAARAYRRAGA